MSAVAIENLERSIRTGLAAALGHLPPVEMIEHVRDAILASHGILQIPESTFVTDSRPAVLYTETPRANLGCATTRQLIDELAARASISEHIGDTWPTYRTVDSE